MFMIQEKKKLIVVCTEKTRKYANYLIQLISEKDDSKEKITGTKDGSVEAVIWSENDYKHNLPIITSNSHILFMGNSKLIKDESANMNMKFNKFGMQFKVLGTRAAMDIEDKLLNKEDYEEFLKFCSKYEKSFKKVHLNMINTANPVIKTIGVFAPVVYPVAIYGLISGAKAKVKIYNQQFICLVTYSYMKFLPDFLGADQ